MLSYLSSPAIDAGSILVLDAAIDHPREQQILFIILTTNNCCNGGRLFGIWILLARFGEVELPLQKKLWESKQGSSSQSGSYFGAGYGGPNYHIIPCSDASYPGARYQTQP